MSLQMNRRSFVATMAAGAAAMGLSACGGQSTSRAQSGSDGASEASSSAAGSAEAGSSAQSSDDPVIRTPLDNGYSSGLHHATIEVKDYGTISLELNADKAPITVSNFAQLANDGFYDGLTFHRIIEGFMIQGGDPKGDGTGGAEKRIKGEFILNDVNNPLVHTRGAISMARSSDNDSASSQFFIMQETDSSLDGQYAAFGHVTEGIEVVDKIAKQTPVQDSNGTVAPEDQPVITSIKMVD